MNFKQSKSIKPGKSNRKKQPVTRASSGMNFFLGTIKYEPEEIEEPSDPNKLDQHSSAYDDEIARAKTKEETVKKKRLKFEHIPIQDVIEDRAMNIQ